MTREEAKEILLRHNEWRRGGEGGMESPTAIGEAIDVAIEALGSPWIPVTERLPKYRQTVLAYNGVMSLCVFDELFFYPAKQLGNHIEPDRMFAKHGVTHWKPIPKIKED